MGVCTSSNHRWAWISCIQCTSSLHATRIRSEISWPSTSFGYLTLLTLYCSAKKIQQPSPAWRASISLYEPLNHLSISRFFYDRNGGKRKNYSGYFSYEGCVLCEIKSVWLWRGSYLVMIWTDGKSLTRPIYYKLITCIGESSCTAEGRHTSRLRNWILITVINIYELDCLSRLNQLIRAMVAYVSDNCPFQVTF